MKKVGVICSILIVLIIFSLGFLKGNNSNEPVVVEYPTIETETNYVGRLFDNSYVHEVNVIISNSDWDDLKTNPLNKTKYKVDVVIDGIELKKVSFNTKGNSSLNNIANGPKGGPASNRYSFKINFGKYVDDQTYFGLDKLNLNNVYGDASYLNDYLSYEIFRQVDVPAPLVSFAYLKVNGENFGLYTAVEEVSDSFFERNNLKGNLYKPEQENGVDNGATLLYKDDEVSSYSDIFNNAENDINEEDKIRLIQALKTLYSRKEIESAIDVNEVIRYFVAHNFVLSYDSYTGKSIHNYYLKEQDGILSMLPWDYNLAFGRYNMSEDVTTIVNYGIDTPLNLAHEKERPMWNWITNEKFLAEYHSIMSDLITNFFETGKYEQEIDSIFEIIRPYIQQDISAFYNVKQAETAVQTLKTFCKLRAESIRMQLNGELSTATDKQDSSKKVDSSNIDLNKLGLVVNDKRK